MTAQEYGGAQEKSCPLEALQGELPNRETGATVRADAGDMLVRDLRADASATRRMRHERQRAETT
eukprot:3408847-Pyramimonas_sp.AAC.1